MMRYSPILFLFLCSLVACNRQVQRISTDQAIDLSGRWNNTDNRLVSEEMVSSFVSASWLDDYIEKNGKKPTIIVGFFVNKSHEHIDAEAFTKGIEKAIVSSNKTRLVQGGAKRESLRAERSDQQTNASSSTMKKFGLESGADYMLQGSITSVVDAYKKKKVVQYEVSMEATNIQTNEIIWLDSKKITKYVKN